MCDDRFDEAGGLRARAARSCKASLVTHPASPPISRLDLGDGSAREWKTPRREPPAMPPTPMTNEWSTGGLSVGDAVEAMGRAPGGERAWFKAQVIGLRERAWPPIVVRYTATLEGALPEPITAYLHADDVRRAA